MATTPKIQMSPLTRELSENSPKSADSTAAATGLSSPLSNTTHPTTLNRAVSRISTQSNIEYRVYKRRFFGLVQLMLLNIVVSWDWLAFAPVSQTAALYFQTTESVINWFSTAFLFAFVVATPVTFWALNKHGPKLSIMIASILLLIGNWIKYGGTRANSIGTTMLGQLLIGFAQPFVLSAPTCYSNLWFSSSGRTSATALASLSNPLGGALGQLITPFWVNSKPGNLPNSILYVSIISSVACIPSFFIPHSPPTPPSAGAATSTHLTTTPTLAGEMVALLASPEFYLIFTPFVVYVGLFNAMSSLLNQILGPYGFSEDNAGIAGAILIVVGLVSAAISSPLVDKYKPYLWYMRVSVPLLAFSYLVFIWAPASRSLAFVFVMCALIGASSFGLVPVTLEFLVEIHYPLGPELSSSLCWCGGQLLGGIFIVIMTALRAGKHANPSENMTHALWFQTILAMLAMPVPLCLGLFGRKSATRTKRFEVDKEGQGQRVVEQVVDVAVADREITNHADDEAVGTDQPGRDLV
ncbi:hypothetical protein DV737_g3846, partial [Chaetothyriales sp. CBS 132003]